MIWRSRVRTLGWSSLRTQAYAAASRFCNEARRLLSKLVPVVMGPCVRSQGRNITPVISSRFLEQLPADQHAPDFAGAGADLVQLGVAQQPAGRIVVDIAVAAEQLDGVERALRRLLGGVENGAGRVLAGGLAAVASLRHR